MAHSPSTTTPDAALTLALEHQTRALLTELDKRFQSFDTKWESRVGALESQAIDSDRRIVTLRADIEAHLTESDVNTDSRLRQIEEDAGARVACLESAVQVFDSWRPRVDSSIAHLQASLEHVHTSLAAMDQPGGFGTRGILGAYGSAPARPPGSAGHADGPNFGHRFDNPLWDSGYRYPPTDFHYPVTGTWNHHTPTPFSFAHTGNYHGEDMDTRRALHHHISGLPKINFPVFDGTCPKLWQKKCENYFEMYATEEVAWVKVATMHFNGVANRWLQSIEPRLASFSWHQFCQAVHDRFGREQHELVIRKLFHIRQTSSVQDYVDRFCELIDLLVTYEHTTDPLYYTMRFIDGLRDGIKAVILVQRPRDLDTACALALLQEEAESSRRRDHPRLEGSHSFRSFMKHPSATTFPDKNSPGIGADQAKVSTPSSSSAESKVASLRAYRRARGLCQFCAEKWVKGHKCSATVQLHVMQELWDMVLPDKDESDGEFQDSAEQFLMAISKEATVVPANSKAFRLRGSIQGVDMLILLDCGSTHCFLDNSYSTKLSGVVAMEQALTVKVANGELLYCNTQLPDASWTMHGLTFTSTFKLVPLPFYDMILGMDWLEQFSPMFVDWKHK
ncbi:uncharacterized protein [Zea mays]|jgi:hypothetical protein|uniref:uncharacterized protein n=1 Tax=Zea mays TaxID=4577 RepID=UPI00165203F9|nr:uncharacterized protein LOC118476633 [Zea mays]